MGSFLGKNDEIIVYSTSKDVFTGKYTVTLMGGEFDNCHGQGSTVAEAVIGLKFRINQLRDKRNEKT